MAFSVFDLKNAGFCTFHPGIPAAKQPSNQAAKQPSSQAARPSRIRASGQPGNRAAKQPSNQASGQSGILACFLLLGNKKLRAKQD